jgi:hypothetical protein
MCGIVIAFAAIFTCTLEARVLVVLETVANVLLAIVTITSGRIFTLVTTWND